MKIFIPCADGSHNDCAFLNGWSGDLCGCSCHTPENIDAKVKRMEDFMPINPHDKEMIQAERQRREDARRNNILAAYDSGSK